jgi:hypothetical protein
MRAAQEKSVDKLNLQLRLWVNKHLRVTFVELQLTVFVIQQYLVLHKAVTCSKNGLA